MYDENFLKFSDFTDRKTALEENCNILHLICVQYFRKNILPVNGQYYKKTLLKQKQSIYNTDCSYVQYSM